MKRLLTALLISCGAHALFFWPKAAPVVHPPVQSSSVFWMEPPASRAANVGRKASGGIPSSREASPSSAEAVEWHSLGELAAEGNTPPPYPLEALERSWEGTVRVRVEFDDEGRPAAVGLEGSSGHTILDEAALGTAKTWHISGGKRRIVVVPVAFKLEDES